jgi:5-methyltetrahydrofolate--homocysteine methyltransferase
MSAELDLDDGYGTEILDAVYLHVLQGDRESAVERVRAGLELGLPATELLFGAMIPALEEVGSRFETGEYFLPEMLISARAMRAAMEVVRPHLSATDAPSLGRFVMGTVAGDIHDIGKDMVDIMLEGAGFEVIDLGVNVPAASFVAAIEEYRPAVVGMSAFLTTTMPQVGRTIEAIRSAGLRHDVRIIIGGAPIDEAFAVQVGADGYAPDASSAVRTTKALLG